MRSYICKNLFFLTLVSFTAESVFALRMIDPHVHTASTAKDTSPYHPKQLVKIMNQFPYVETAFLLSRGYLKPERTYAEQENDHVAQTINEYPDRFIGFCGVNVFLPNALEEIER